MSEEDRKFVMAMAAVLGSAMVVSALFVVIGSVFGGWGVTAGMLGLGAFFIYLALVMYRSGPSE